MCLFLQTGINMSCLLQEGVGREPPDAMSLRYADIEPPRFARQTEPPLAELICTVKRLIGLK